MYFKRYRKGKGRRKLVYINVAHNVWVPDPDGGGQTQPVVVLNLGREAALARGQKEAALAMAEALYSVRIKMGDSPMAALAVVRQQIHSPRMPEEPTSVVGSRAFGMRLLLERVWVDLGMAAAFERYAEEHRLKFPLERVVFGMVLNRLVDPKSKRACNDWLQDLAFFPEWNDDWDVQHFYRALDILHERWAEVEQILYEALWERIPEEARAFLLVDTTSMYFEMNRSDVELAELQQAHWAALNSGGKPPLSPLPQVVNVPPARMRGHNKDGHDGDPQVVIASVVTPGGQIVRHSVYPGNTNDQTIGDDLIAKLPAAAGTRVWCSDAGMVSDEKLIALDLAGWHRVTAASLRSEEFGQDRLLSRSGRYLTDPENTKFSYREEVFTAEELAMGRPEKWIVVRNALERERQLSRLEKHKAQVIETLARQREEDPHGRGVCEIATHKTLRKYVKPSDRVKGQFIFDDEIYRREHRLAGTRLLRTTLLSWEARDVHSAYQLLLEVEDNHRELKTPLQLRPCYHRLDHRIKAHVMINVLAMNCLRQIQQITGLRPADLRNLTERVTAVEMRQGRKTWWQPSDLPDAYREALEKLGIAEPPANWSTWREGRTEGLAPRMAQRA